MSVLPVRGGLHPVLLMVVGECLLAGTASQQLRRWLPSPARCVALFRTMGTIFLVPEVCVRVVANIHVYVRS